MRAVNWYTQSNTSLVIRKTQWKQTVINGNIFLLTQKLYFICITVSSFLQIHLSPSYNCSLRYNIVWLLPHITAFLHLASFVFVTTGKRRYRAGCIHDSSAHRTQRCPFEIRLYRSYWFWPRETRKKYKEHKTKLCKISHSMLLSYIFEVSIVRKAIPIKCQCRIGKTHMMIICYRFYILFLSACNRLASIMNDESDDSCCNRHDC